MHLESFCMPACLAWMFWLCILCILSMHLVYVFSGVLSVFSNVKIIFVDKLFEMFVFEKKTLATSLWFSSCVVHQHLILVLLWASTWLFKNSNKKSIANWQFEQDFWCCTAWSVASNDRFNFHLWNNELWKWVTHEQCSLSVHAYLVLLFLFVPWAMFRWNGRIRFSRSNRL